LRFLDFFTHPFRLCSVFCRAVHYLPGFVFLVFCMLALYSALNHMDAYKALDQSKLDFSKELFRLQDELNSFENTFVIYMSNGKGSASFEKVSKDFGAFYEGFERFRGFLYGYKNHATYLPLLSAMYVDFLDIASAISIIDQNAEQASVVYRGIVGMHENIDRHIHDFLGNKHRGYVYNQVQYSQHWLYWSLIVMGLSGFLLIILNSYQLRELQKNNEEKKETLSLLQSRLAAMEAAHDGIIIVNKEGALSYMNKAFQSLCGISSEGGASYIDQDWKKIYGASDIYELEEYILPDVEAQGYWRDDFTITRRDGKTLFTEMSFTKLPDGGMIGTMQDVSERQRAENDKKELEEQFYQAQKMEAIGRLAGGIAHDFNNILAAMMGYAEFLEDDLEKGSSHRRFAGNILKAGHQARELVDQILAFSRRSNTAKEAMDLVDSVQETVGMLRASLPKTIEVKTVLNLPMASIWANPTQVKQLIMNLCVNARDAMDDDKGVLSISIDQFKPEDFKKPEAIQDDLPDPQAVPVVRLDDGAPGQTQLVLGHLSRAHDYIVLRVSDTGHGMSRTIMERVFEPFFTTKPVEKGTGLGLATVHGVVIGHMGAMVIDSTLGKGTTFSLYFPMGGDVTEQLNKPDINEEQVQGGQDHACVLLVEDQDDVRDMTLVMLERMGYEAAACDTGMEALEVLREDPGVFDLVITDQNMPKMTGMELIHQVYADFPDLPFVLLSGYSEEKIKALIAEHPAVKDVLRKPVTKVQLKKSIEMVLAGRDLQ